MKIKNVNGVKTQGRDHFAEGCADGSFSPHPPTSPRLPRVDHQICMYLGQESVCMCVYNEKKCILYHRDPGRNVCGLLGCLRAEQRIDHGPLLPRDVWAGRAGRAGRYECWIGGVSPESGGLGWSQRAMTGVGNWHISFGRK